MRAMPIVSVILPVHDRLEFLRTAVESVFAQTYTGWELVIADDGSGPETREFLRGLAADSRVRIVWLEHSGNPAAVRNAALRAARGQYVAFLDSDDAFAPRKLELQLAALAQRSRCLWSYCAFVRVDAEERPLAAERTRAWFPADGAIFEEILRGRASLRTPCIVAQRALVEEAGAFDESLLDCEDLDLWMRLALRSEVALVDQVLARVRIAPGSFTARPRHARADLVRVIGKMIAIAPAHLRGAIRREGARQEVLLARDYAAHGAHRRMWSTLARAMPHAWAYPFAWGHGVRALLRSLKSWLE